VQQMKQALMTAGALVFTVAPRLGVLMGMNDQVVKADFSFLTGASVLFDAVYVPGGEASVAALKSENEAIDFLSEAYKHCKPIAASGAGVDLLEAAGLVSATPGDEGASGDQTDAQPGVITSRDSGVGDIGAEFIEAIARHRYWEREPVL